MRSFSRPKPLADPAKNVHCTAFEVDNWILSEFTLRQLVPVVGMHPFPLNELMLMAGAVCRFKPAFIFEWGTHRGRSARVFRETIKAFRIPCAIHSIDLPDDVPHGEHPTDTRGELVRGMAEVTLHQGDGITVALELCARLAADRPVLFFVDGDHSHASVKRELTAILDARPDAIVLLHDTFYQTAESGYNIGPFEAINEVLAERGQRYARISTTTGLPGMTLLHPEPHA